MAELVEHFCLEALPKCGLEFLTALSEEYRITVPDDKKDDKRVILRLVVRHLTSDAVVTAPDEGAAIFLKLYKELGGELKKSAKSEPDMPPLEGEAEESVKDSVAAVSYHKLRQFKINGTIGDPGQKNCGILVRKIVFLTQVCAIKLSKGRHKGTKTMRFTMG